MSTIYPIHRYRFVELYYRRSDQTKEKEKTNGNQSSAGKSRIETTVIFLPDVSSLMPNRGIEWDDVCKSYNETLKKVIASHETPLEETIVISDDNSDSAVVCAVENVKENVERPPLENVEETLAKEAEETPMMIDDADNNTGTEEAETVVESQADVKALKSTLLVIVYIFQF